MSDNKNELMNETAVETKVAETEEEETASEEIKEEAVTEEAPQNDASELQEEASTDEAEFSVPVDSLVVDAEESKKTKAKKSFIKNITKDKNKEKSKSEENNENKEKNENEDPKKQLHLNIYDFVSIIMSAFIIIAIIFTFAFRLVGVKGQSMESTLHEGDWLITMEKDEYVYGEIVVITEPNYFNEPLIKRVIATGGQTVDIDYASSTVYVNGVALKEPYINESFIIQNYDDLQFPYTVPEGKLFCMGDNRNHSTDSRSVKIGSVDERYILGKAVVRLLPFGDFDIYDYE